MTKITARVIAERTGYSVSAVSRAFRPSAPISADTRSRILAVAKELGYSGPAARFSDGFSHRSVALVMGDMANPFYPTTVQHLSQILHMQNVRMIFHTIPENLQVDDVMEQVLDYRVDGAIIASASMSSRLAHCCRAARIRVIHYNRVQTDNLFTAVCCDNYGGAQTVARYLLQKGRTRYAFLGGRPDTSTHLERARGFRDALAQAGASIAGETSGMFRYDAALEASRTLLSLRPRINALFCCNDVMALAALDVARCLGIRVPDDVAIVGFDDIPMAAWESYGLTTIHQPVRRMLHEVVSMIFDPSDIQGQIRILPGKMRIRRSA